MNKRDELGEDIKAALGWYVYRLIDPRTGQTFYVGKGKGDRVIQHAAGKTSGADENDLKLQTIKEIHSAALDVIHLIHRHNIRDEETALQIEAALIDAYPGLTNKVSGHGSGDYGCRHLKEIIADYRREPFKPAHKGLLISISASYEDEGRSIYDAVRFAWKLSPENARNYPVVVAHRRGLVEGVFIAEEWLEATQENFPQLAHDMPDRIGFVGHEAGPEIAECYLGKSVPKELRRRGAANPVRYIEPDMGIAGV